MASASSEASRFWRLRAGAVETSISEAGASSEGVAEEGRPLTLRVGEGAGAGSGSWSAPEMASKRASIRRLMASCSG